MLTDQLSQIKPGNRAGAADRVWLGHSVPCCVRNGSSVTASSLVFWFYHPISWLCHWANYTYTYYLSVRTERVGRPLAWRHYDLHLSTWHSKWRLWPFLKVKDLALQMTTGSKESLGSCSYIRINLSIHLKGKQHGLTTLRILENGFGLPENQNIPQSDLFILKVICQLPVMIFIFLNNFFYALSFKFYFLFKEVGLWVFYEGQIHVYILRWELRTNTFYY